MKAEKVRELSDAELESQVRDLESQIWKLRSLRRDIARSRTILRERGSGETHGR